MSSIRNRVSTPSVLIVGAGSIGKRHARNLRELGVERISICDPSDVSRNAAVAEALGPVYADYQEALKKAAPQIVFICSPTKLHVEQAIAAARTGAHLFIEKPLSYSMEALDMLRRDVQGVCMVGCNMRFHFGPAKVKQLLESNIIGAVKRAVVVTASYLPDWRPQQDYKKSYSADPEQGGAILDCIHELDLALWYFGPATLAGAEVQRATELGLAVEGTADLHLHHENGAESDVHLSFMEPGYKRMCAVEGEKGFITWDINKKKVEVFDAEENSIASFAEPEKYDLNQMYVEELRHFLQCTETHRKPMGNLEEASRALELALEAKNTAKQA